MKPQKNKKKKLRKKNNPNAEEAKKDAKENYNILPEKEKPDVDKVTETVENLTEKKKILDDSSNKSGDTSEITVEDFNVNISEKQNYNETSKNDQDLKEKAKEKTEEKT